MTLDPKLRLDMASSALEYCQGLPLTYQPVVTFVLFLRHLWRHVSQRRQNASFDQLPVGAADSSEKLAMTGALVELPVR